MGRRIRVGGGADARGCRAADPKRRRSVVRRAGPTCCVPPDERVLTAAPLYALFCSKAHRHPRRRRHVNQRRCSSFVVRH
jgi:hypothetical protein